MRENEYLHAQYVYDRICGMSEIPPGGLENVQVESAFAPGSECDQLYTQITQTAQQICQRLNSEDDRDVERLVDLCFGIARRLSLKMYEYGEAHAREMQ